MGNESGPVCLGASLKKEVHSIYIPTHTLPESKIINSKSGLGLGTFIGKTLLERMKAKIEFGNDGELKGACVKIKWQTKNLLNILDFPLAAPSANISSKLSPTSAKDVSDEFKNKIKMILDGGKCTIGIESTIIDLTQKPCILRPGIITAKQIQKILKKKILINKKHKQIKGPGQLRLHYSPGIPVKINRKNPKNSRIFW